MIIHKEAKSLSAFTERRIFTASARAAMLHILSALTEKDDRKILLPAYIGLSKIEGSGVFDPVRAAGMPHGFYGLSERLVPDIQCIENQLRTGQYKAVFLIHYFGCCQTDLQTLVDLCHDYDALVIEDCAHTVLGGLGPQRLGSYGDFSIHSIHKSLATTDGGFLFDNKGQLAQRPVAEVSRISRQSLETWANTDVVSASKRRRENFFRVASCIERVGGVEPLFNTIAACEVPLNFPVLVPDNRREALYFRLMEAGVAPTALYHTLIPEISREEFPLAYRTADTILNLPTHPDILEQHWPTYLEHLEIAIKETI